MFPEVLHIKDMGFPSIHLPIHNKITILTGDSAIGKSWMLHNLVQMQNRNSPGLVTTIPLDSILVVNKRSDIMLRGSVRKISDMLIFIDRFDFLICPELVQFIQTSNNKFVLCSHLFYDELNVLPGSVLLLQYSLELNSFTTDCFFGDKFGTELVGCEIPQDPISQLEPLKHKHSSIQLVVDAYGGAPLTPDTIYTIKDMLSPLAEEIPELKPILERIDK